MNYMERIVAAKQKHPKLFVGLFDVEVRHDEWCPVLKGNRNCTCRPDLFMKRIGTDSAGVVWKIDDEGNCVQS